VLRKQKNVIIVSIFFMNIKEIIIMARNETLMQYFEWYLSNDGIWWKRCMAKAKPLADAGVTGVWLPPAYKGTSQDDVGYGVYDMYDLGEFDQKGTIRTKYGTKEEYIKAIKTFQKEGVKVYADIVLNHRLGADETEDVMAYTVAQNDRNQVTGGERLIKVWSKFTFPGRKGKYSKFIWDHNSFTGTDWDENTKEKGQLYCFSGKKWEQQTDIENGNYDYLMGCDVDMDNPEVVDEIFNWLSWYIDETGIDGVRLDAVKHIKFDFYRDMIKRIRTAKKIPLPAVGEYWSGDIGRLQYYLDTVENQMSLFDVTLHYNFYNASVQGAGFDMKMIFDNALVQYRPDNAVTFVDNHDTQYGQSLESFIQDWFKPLAYAIILLREAGMPCIFYSDFYGNPGRDRPAVPNLERLIRIRKSYAYGEQKDYFDDFHIVGWTRGGDKEHPDSGLAVLMSNAEGGGKDMYVGKQFAGELFYDAMGECTEPVQVREDGNCTFYTDSGKVSVWLRKGAFEDIEING